MDNPRVYIAIATFHPMVGGAEKQALLQGRSLRERGIDATIITFRHDKSWAARDIIDGVPVVRVAGALLGRRGKLPRAIQKLLYLLALVVMGCSLWRYRRYYEVLHVYQMTMLVLPAALVCLLVRKPIIIGVRNAGLDRGADIQKRPLLLAGPLDAGTPWLKVSDRIPVGGDLTDLERFGKLFVHFTHSLLQRIHAVAIILSSRMKSYLTDHNFTLSDTRLIPNGVDIQHFTPIGEDSRSDQQTQVVVCVARLCFQKGIDVLLQSWRLVQQELPQSQQAKLIIVGIGPLQAQLERMARVLGLANCVEFAGLQEDILTQLRRSCFAVLPSRQEGMPNAILEAMACGLPCVATRVSGSEDIIQHSVNGLLVEPEDYQGMAQAMLTLLRRPELREAFSKAARATIEQNYSLQHFIDIYIQLYRSIAMREVSIHVRNSGIY